MEIDEEIEVIKSIYCRMGELEITTDACNGYHISLHLAHNKSSTLALDVNIVVSSQYPIRPPEVSLISRTVSVSDVKSLKDKVSNSIKESPSLPCVVEIVTLITDEFNNLASNCSEIPREKENGDSQTTVAVLHLDHMRARTQYVKLIEKWTSELNLNGRLIFYNRLILILLVGNSDDIKEYIHRNRTVNVDVDSRGQSCKERMLSILCEEQVERKNISYSNFEVMNCDKEEDIVSIFTGDLREIYNKYITCLSGHGLKS